MKKWIINLVLIFLLISLFIWIIEDKNADDNIKENYESTTLSTENETIIQEVKQYPKEEIPKTYKGYDVCAKLEIPEISLTTYILSTYSTESLKVSVTKFWGVNPNENGNFCVAGHNYINKNMFRNLKKLNIGDELYVTDSKIGKVKYVIFDIYKVEPEDVSCLDAVTYNQKEITLITCTSDSKKRIIIKAKEDLNVE